MIFFFLSGITAHQIGFSAGCALVCRQPGFSRRFAMLNRILTSVMCSVCLIAVGCMDETNRGMNQSRDDKMREASSQHVDRGRVEQMIQSWPQHSKMAAMD